MYGLSCGRPALPVGRVHRDAVVELGRAGCPAAPAARSPSPGGRAPAASPCRSIGVTNISSTISSYSLFVHFGKLTRWAPGTAVVALWYSRSVKYGSRDAAAVAVERRRRSRPSSKRSSRVGRLAVGRVDALAPQQLLDDRADRGERAGPEPMISSFSGLPSGVGPDAVAVLLEALLLEQRVALLRVELGGRVLLEQILDRVEVRLQRRVRRHRQRRRRAGAAPADVDDLLAVDVVAERPAHVRVVERLDGVVDVERGRPPVDVAVRLVAAGVGDDLRVLLRAPSGRSTAGGSSRSRPGW